MDKAIDEKLNLLAKLQEIDSDMDAIERLKGELPEEIEDLEDRLVGYTTRISRIDEEIKEIKNEVSTYKVIIDEAKELIQKYTAQQKGIRNNREFDALTKEIELQKLEIKLSEKKIKENKEVIKEKEISIKETNKLIKAQKGDIEAKKKELDQITKDNEKQEKKFSNARKKIEDKLDKQLLDSYTNLRNNLRNKLAVIIVHREACGGCFNIVTPQRQVDIRARNKIMVCEHCGRIIAGIDDPEIEDKETPKTAVTSKSSKS